MLHILSILISCKLLILKALHHLIESMLFLVIFRNQAPKIYAVADHNRVLVSWDASAESSIDSLTDMLILKVINSMIYRWRYLGAVMKINYMISMVISLDGCRMRNLI